MSQVGPMHVTEHLKLEDVFMNVASPSRRAVLQFLSTKAAAVSKIDAATILASLEAREMLGSTGVGHGIAIPHATFAGIDRPIGVLATLNRAVDYDAVDDEPVDIVFLLLIPKKDTAAGLRALAMVAKLLRVTSLAAQIRQATNSKDIYATIADLEVRKSSS